MFSGRILGISIILSANRDSLLSSFLVCIPVICFSCLFASASTLNTMLKSSEDRNCLVSNFRWITSSFSPFRMIFLLYSFYCVDMCSLLYIFWEVYHKGILNFVKSLFSIHWDGHWFLSLIHFYRLLHLLICMCWSILHFRDKANLVMVYDLFYFCLYSVCKDVTK